jgi:hypothetical protein
MTITAQTDRAHDASGQPERDWHRRDGRHDFRDRAGDLLCSGFFVFVIKLFAGKKTTPQEADPPATLSPAE